MKWEIEFYHPLTRSYDPLDEKVFPSVAHIPPLELLEENKIKINALHEGK
jgi:hypothetical protein